MRRERERGLHCKCLLQKLWTVQLLTNVEMAVVSFDIESDTTAAIKAGLKKQERHVSPQSEPPPRRISQK